MWSYTCFRGYSLFLVLVFDSQPLVELLLPDTLLCQPPEVQNKGMCETCVGNALNNSTDARRVDELGHLHEVLIPGLPELDEIWLDAVHPLVDLPVVSCLFLQVFLQTTLAVHDLTDARLQLLVVHHYPGKSTNTVRTANLANKLQVKTDNSVHFI